MRSASSRNAGRPARSSDLRGRVLAGTTSRLMRGTLGYSFVELLVVSSILLILASAVAPLAQVTMQRQREIELRRALREMRTAIDGYKDAVDLGVIGGTEIDPENQGYPPSDPAPMPVVNGGAKERCRLPPRVPRPGEGCAERPRRGWPRRAPAGVASDQVARAGSSP